MLQGQTVQKMKLAILDGDELAAAYSVPRLIALEYQLNRMCKNNERLDGILQLLKNHLEKQSEVITEISGQFLWRYHTRCVSESLMIFAIKPLVIIINFDIKILFMAAY